MARPLPTLEQALAYENEDIPRRFLDDWVMELEDARLLFDDVKRWLFLGEQPDVVEATIHGPLLILDEMWHNFVLFTKEYTAYCTDVYGRYLHHGPTTQREALQVEAEFAASPDAARARFVERRARQRDAVVRYLGVETLIRWYVDYPIKFGDEFFATARKPMTMAWTPDAELVALAAQLRAAAG